MQREVVRVQSMQAFTQENYLTERDLKDAGTNMNLTQEDQDGCAEALSARMHGSIDQDGEKKGRNVNVLPPFSS